MSHVNGRRTYALEYGLCSFERFSVVIRYIHDRFNIIGRLCLTYVPLQLYVAFQLLLSCPPLCPPFTVCRLLTQPRRHRTH